MAFVRSQTHQVNVPRIRGLLPLPSITTPIFTQEILPAVLLPVGGAYISGYASRLQDSAWYKLLRQPSWALPEPIYGAVWTGLCGAMGYASWMVYRQGNGFSGAARTPLMLYGATLLLDWAWAPVLSSTHKPGLALAHTAAIWASLAATAAAFHPINNTAAYLLVPSLAWLAYIGAVLHQVWRDNPNADKL